MEIFSNPGNNTANCFGFYIGPLKNNRPRLFKKGFATEKRSQKTAFALKQRLFGVAYMSSGLRKLLQARFLYLDIDTEGGLKFAPLGPKPYILNSKPYNP